MSNELEQLTHGNTTWIKGANVLVINSSGGRAIRPITRITDGRGGTVYVDKDAFDAAGRKRGQDGWSYTSIETLTPEKELELRKQFRAANQRNRIRGVLWNEVSDDNITTVHNLLLGLGIIKQ